MKAPSLLAAMANMAAIAGDGMRNLPRFLSRGTYQKKRRYKQRKRGVSYAKYVVSPLTGATIDRQKRGNGPAPPSDKVLARLRRRDPDAADKITRSLPECRGVK